MGKHQDLVAWQNAKTLATACRRLARGFPADERDLADQLRRAADSAALNIAEGNVRGSNREFRQFLQTSRASLKEVEAIIELAADAGYVVTPALESIQALSDQAARTVYGLLRAVDERVRKGETDRPMRPAPQPSPIVSREKSAGHSP